MQAITHKIKESNPKTSVCYISSERFTNELIDAIRHRSTAQFRQKHRNMDVLLIDDIHFIAGKESTQEEFFHTFNTLHDNHKQIIISSDRPPKEISNLEERLISRFAWGLITDVQPPTFETRVAILKKKMEREPIEVPEDVITFIAQEIKTNIRELEGALIRVVAYSLLEEKVVSLAMAKAILKDMVQENMKIIDIDVILKRVADFFHIKTGDFKTKRRQKSIVLPRQIAMYLSRQLTNLSLPEIGKAFGGKDHTTVLHSCKKIEENLSQNKELKSTINSLTASLK
jgi:chromosomal replication initiator protein